MKIGFEVDLIGTHDHPKQPPKPGCEECHLVYSNLLRIATAVLPAEDRDSRYVIEPYEASISLSPRRKKRKDVTVSIDIVHRGPFDQPIDACETRCLHEIDLRRRFRGAGCYDEGDPCVG